MNKSAGSTTRSESSIANETNAATVESNQSNNATTFITVLQDGLTAFGFVRARGEEITITPEMYEATIDREGNSWIDRDVESQRRFYGREMFVTGEHGDAIRRADDEAQEAVRATQKANTGISALEGAWAAEDRAARAAKHRTESRTTARSKPMTT